MINIKNYGRKSRNTLCGVAHTANTGPFATNRPLAIGQKKVYQALNSGALFSAVVKDWLNFTTNGGFVATSNRLAEPPPPIISSHE
jgi:hypothetical protein